MLEGLDEIDWSSHRHAYGEAGDVPGLLRNLISDDSTIRAEAIYELFGNIWHQGTVYSATAAALPFLIELLDAADIPDKSSIAFLVASIATGNGYLRVHAASEESNKQWRNILKAKGRSLEVELTNEASVLESIRRTIAPNLKRLSVYLRDKEPAVREAVATALANYPEHADWSLPAIEAALAVEEDEGARHYMKESRDRMTCHQSKVRQ